MSLFIPPPPRRSNVIPLRRPTAAELSEEARADRRARRIATACVFAALAGLAVVCGWLLHLADLRTP